MRVKTFMLALLIYSSAMAGGWDNSLIGARSAGLGTAFVGIANNATAIYYNSAGLAYIEPRAQFIICGKQYHPTHTYVNPTGKKITSKIDATLVELFTYYRFSDRVTLGFGLFTPYAGGGIKWSEKDLGYSLKGSIGTIALSPTLTYKLFPDLAIGLNFNYLYFVSTQSINDPNRVFTPPGGFPSGYLEKLDADEKGSEHTFTISIFYRPNNTASMGFTYHGPTEVDLAGKSNIKVSIPGTPLSFEKSCDSFTYFYLPQSYAFGFCYRLKPKLLIATEIDYFLWSKLRSVKKVVKNTPPAGLDIEYNESLGFNNSYYLKFGAEYLYSEKITLRFGTSYDNGKVSKEAYSITNIDVTKINFLAGLGYNMGIFNINIAGFYSIGREESVPATPNDEKYDLDSVGILASIVSDL